MNDSSDKQDICHYTNFEVLKNIVTNCCFWAFSTLSQIDKDEVKYGVNYIIKNDNVEPCFKKLLENYLRDDLWNSYIICFSNKRNSNKMWKNYVKDKNSGLAFVFDEPKLLNSFKKKSLSWGINNTLKLYIPKFLPCQYSDDSNFLVSYFDQKITELNQWFKQQSCRDMGIMFEKLIGLAYAIKHEKFAYEDEKRIFLPPTVTSFLSAEKEVGERKYVEFPFDIELFLDSIKAIDISPDASKYCKKQVECFLSQYDKKICKKIIQCKG